MSYNKIICDDCIKVLPTLPEARMIFADPPDNTGVEYDGFVDKWKSDAKYLSWLTLIATSGYPRSDVMWLSYYWKWDFGIKGNLYREDADFVRNIKPFIWRFTFGQHQQKDCGSGFRPILRFSKPGIEWNTDDIRVPSDRQTKYHDKRADPRGRVPDDVWDFPRVCGSFKEKRKWHKNQHPEALIKRMILMSTKPGDLVWDLFAGSGTVNRVCKELGRSCIGIEISEAYCDKIQEELAG